MKGKKQFTKSEIQRLKEILKDKESVFGKQQKSYRDKLRGMGFYITDFDSSYKGFTDEDLDELIRNETITIKD